MRGFWYQKITLFCKRRWKKNIIAIVFFKKNYGSEGGGGARKYFWSPITRVSYQKAVFVVFLLFWCSFRCKFHANVKKKNFPIFVTSASVTSHFVLLTKTKSPRIFPTLIVVHQAVRLTNNKNREKHVN